MVSGPQHSSRSLSCPLPDGVTLGKTMCLAISQDRLSTPTQPLAGRQSGPSLGTIRRQALHQANCGQDGEAIALLDTVISHYDATAGDYNNRGLLHFRNGHLEAALADYNQALCLNPKLAKVYNNRANCYAALGQLEAAIADYDTAIDLNPVDVRAWINRGITFRDLNQYEQAIETFELALQLWQMTGSHADRNTDLLDGHIYAERGRTYHLLGDWNYAIADYHRALAILPSVRSIAASESSRLRSQVQYWLDYLLNPFLSA